MKKVKLNWVLIHHSKLWKQNLNNLKKVLGDKECKTEEMFEIIEVENGNIKRNFDTWKIDHNVIICILMTLLGTETNLGAILQGIWKVLFIYEIFMQDGRFNTYIYIYLQNIQITAFQMSLVEKERNKWINFKFKQQISCRSYCKVQAETRIKISK